MKIVKESHLDHALSQAVIDHLLSLFGDRNAFFIETIELPDGLGTVPCGLHGPIMGDPPIDNDKVWFETRGDRAYKSRLCDRPVRQVRTVTVIAGPHESEPCVLYTAFGGPLAPQEPGDPTCKDLQKSRDFWSEHALSV